MSTRPRERQTLSGEASETGIVLPVLKGVMMSKGIRRRDIGWWSATVRNQSKLPSLESVAAEALSRSLRNSGGKPKKSDKYPCVVEVPVTSRQVGDLLGPLGGQAIQQKRSFLADRLGKQVAADLLTITEDPWLP